jgi:multiple sugar transport system permease protein
MILVLPATALMVIFFLVPMVVAAYLAFTNQELEGPHAIHYQIIGLANFSKMASDFYFKNSLWLTVIFVGGSAVVGQTVFGLILALLQERALRWLRLAVASIAITAWVMPEISAAVIWYAFGQNGGTLDTLLGPGHSDLNWFSTAPMLIVCSANVWRGSAFSMLIFGAGLRNVPDEVKESAVLDGANAWQRLIHIILPIIRPTIVTNLILVTIGNLADFTLIYGMTQGGPNNETMTLPIYMYIQSFNFYELGYGTAIALVLIVIGAIASFLYVQLLRSEI